MINVIDRVPTEKLDNGAIRWEQFDEQGNSLGYVYMKRADEPTVEGTPINKVLFDSIKAELDTKLNISSKATQEEAIGRVDNTKYMTPFLVDKAVSQLLKVTNYEVEFHTAGTRTPFSLDDVINTNTVFLEVEGYVQQYWTESTESEWVLNDTTICGVKIDKNGVAENYTMSRLSLCDSRYKASFKIRIDVKNRTCCLIKYHSTSMSRYTRNNDYTIITGEIQGDSFGSISAGRKEDETTDGYIVVRTYESPDIIG